MSKDLRIINEAKLLVDMERAEVCVAPGLSLSDAQEEMLVLTGSHYRDIYLH